MPQETVFSKIIRGDIPCHRVYEDAQVLAFLDAFPIAPGHTLVVPKKAYETLDAMSEEDAAALGKVLPRICRAVCAATRVRDYNVLQNNGSRAHQAVLHVHFHIIPKPSDSAGLELGWPAAALEQVSGKKIAEAIAAQL